MDQDKLTYAWDAIIVAGCRVAVDGTPSHALRRRTALAIELWRAKHAPTIVLTGGSPIGQRTSEADAAASFALEHGVPEWALIREDRSRTTEENAYFASHCFPAERIILVTDNYHCFRARRVFLRYFRTVKAVGARPPPLSWLRGAAREALSIGLYRLHGKL
jgi:uncharacterized SAM-binding protein YcdF (DUF218 family)